jgi:nucleotide-binding universal stress UspA family protein
MNMPNDKPTKILLATDLSSRCDRALDRAAQLAEQWQAELVALNILESTQAPDMALTWAYGNEDTNVQIAERQLLKDLAGLKVKLSARIAHGDVTSAIETVASEEHCDLVVTGMARNETFGRFLLGSTVERLAKELPLPMLVVRSRPRGKYSQIVIATDFSASSKHAVLAALRFFPEQYLTLYHAHNKPLSDAIEDYSSELNQAAMQRAFTDFLDTCELSDAQRQRFKSVSEIGTLETVLTHYVRANDIDLVIIGTQGHNGLMGVLLGSNAAKLLDWLPCDTMTVRAPKPNN